MTKLKVGILPIAAAGGYFVAEAQGYFKKNNLELTSSTITGGASLIPALESGAMNVGFSNLVSVLESGTHHFGMQCLAGTLRKPATGHNLPLLVSPKDASSITSAKDLNGKTVAQNTLGNINQLLTEDWMAKNGGTYKSVHFTSLPFPTMPSALARGAVDAAVVAEPFATLAIKAGAKILNPRPYQVVAKSPVYSCWLASKKWIDAHKAAARAFVTALDQADSYLTAHPTYLRKILPTYTKISATLAQQITLPIITTALSPLDLNVWEKPALEFGLLKTKVSVTSLISHLGP